jgi:hypothetical protein
MSAITPYKSRTDELIAAYRAAKSAPATTAGLAAWVVWALAALLVAAVVLPLFLIDIVPLTDFPAHLARVTLLSHLPLDPLLARAWAVDMRPLPNLAMDVFVPLVAPVLGAEVGLKVFMALGVALWVAGAVLIYRALWREWSPQPLFAVFFATNATFYYGFSNFHVGAGLALTAAGVWALTERRGPLLLAAMSLVALVLLFCHLMAVGIFGLIVGGLELGRLWRARASAPQIARALAEGAVVFLPAALAWGLLFEHGRETGVEFKWLNNLLALFIYSSGAGAIRYNALPFLAMGAAFALAWRTGRLRIAYAALPAVALLVVATLLCPAVALSGAIIHVRLPAVACVLILVSARVVLDQGWRAPLMAGLAVATFACGALEYARWLPGAAEIAAIRAAAARHIETGARVMTALAGENDFALAHAVDLTVLDRKTFVPSFFTTRGQSTIVVKDAYRDIAAGDTIEGAFPTFAEIAPFLRPERPTLTPAQYRALRPYRDMACEFDYLYVIGDLPEGSAPPASLRLLEAEKGFSLYKIVAPAERGCGGR